MDRGGESCKGVGVAAVIKPNISLKYSHRDCERTAALAILWQLMKLKWIYRVNKK